ncbi:hypothetical protein H072_7441 [Dactylellina haptotyla CBS 200.50]|uniref:Uncharacterized protein n=1 Tax=Dactylellina haptotyla (strain CBS 200.50) TaxID=1284197 RepID=S8BU53_DACHA|nr:hypothetical protein H072_7441 [Dactylellina haptotyla CBS 200.50]
MDNGFNVGTDRSEEEYPENRDAYTTLTSNLQRFRTSSRVATPQGDDSESGPYQPSNIEGFNMEIDDPAFDPNIDPLLQNIAANPGEQTLDSTDLLEDLNDVRDAMGEFRRASDQSSGKSYVGRSPRLRYDVPRKSSLRAAPLTVRCNVLEQEMGSVPSQTVQIHTPVPKNATTRVVPFRPARTEI